jgi:8-oxo-dGTP diphosphatase
MSGLEQEQSQTEVEDHDRVQGRYCYDYPRPAVTVDITLFAHLQGEWRLLLIQRGGEPFRGDWALPGGFVEIDEDLEQAAQRELEEETGIRYIHLEQLLAFGDPHRDPRTRIISIVHYAHLSAAEAEVVHVIAGDDASDARWWPANALPPLAFDHSQIVNVALDRLRRETAQ